MNDTEHRCSACGKVVGHTKQRRPAVGRAFETCPQCDGCVLREPFNEWALMSLRTKLEVLGSGGAFFLALGLVPAVLYGLFGIVTGNSTDVLLLVLIGVIGAAVSLGSWGARISADVRQSQRRMSDPMYQAKMVEFGIQKRRDQPSPPLGSSHTEIRKP